MKIKYKKNLFKHWQSGYPVAKAMLQVIFLVLVINFSVCGQEINKPNILLILSDDHSYPHLGCYGNVNILQNNITPNLDNFASQAMRFDRAYTAAPQCAPSRISIFAGRSPVRLDVTRFAQPPKSDVLFFTDILKQKGYWTGIDGRHQHLDGRLNESEHIQETLIDEGMKNLDSRFDHFVAHWGTKGDNLEKIGDKINNILDEVPDGKSFFLYFGFNQPHRRFGKSHKGIDPGTLQLPPDWPDLPEVRTDYANFLSEVRDLDRGFGQIMEVLKARNLEENTIVIFMGDNGEALFRGKGTVHGRGINVPLVIRWPDVIPQNTESSALVSGVDLAPTILEAAGLNIPEEMTGKSFVKVLKGAENGNRQYIFAERGWHWVPLTRSDGFDLSRSITFRKYHYIYNALPDRAYFPVDMVNMKVWKKLQKMDSLDQLSALHQKLYFQKPRPIFELYDLENDPYELQNLAGKKEFEEVEREHRQQLEKWMVREHDFLPLPGHVILNQKN